MLLRCLLCLLLSLSSYADVPNTSNSKFLGYFSAADKLRFKQLFEQKLGSDTKEIDILFYSSLGLSSLDEKVPNVQCSQAHEGSENPETVFQSSYLWGILGKEKCRLTPGDVNKLANSKLVEGATLETLFYTVMSLNNMGLEVNQQLLNSLIGKAKAKNTNPLGIGLLLQLISQLKLPKPDMQTYLADVEDVLQQADEIDGNQLFYDRGLYTTAVVVKGIMDFVESIGEIPTHIEDKLVKLFNYLYTHRETGNLRAAAHIVAAMKTLATSSLRTPVMIANLMHTSHVTITRSNPVLQIQLVHVWTGTPFSTSDIVLRGHGFHSVKPGSPDRTLIGPSDRGKFQAVAEKKDTFQLSLQSEPELLKAGSHYELGISGNYAKSDQQKKLLGLSNIEIPVRIMTSLKIAESAVKLSDKIHDRHVTDITLTPQNLYKSSSPSGAIIVESGIQLTWYFRFVEQDQPNLPLSVHQAFVQFTHSKTKQMITFICKQIAALGQDPGVMGYQLVLDPEASAADFDYVSGIYRAELIVGDSNIRNPFVWYMTDLELNFMGTPGEESARRAAQAQDISRLRSPTHAASKFAPGPNTLIGTGPSSAKPEIDHLFRPPERRAPRTLAYLFSLLCLLPLVFVLIAWMVIGFNISNFKLSLGGILFHTGLGAIFYLYYLYWTRLDMFATLGYLAIIGVPTFLAGSSVLRHQAQIRQAISITSSGGTKK